VLFWHSEQRVFQFIQQSGFGMAIRLDDKTRLTTEAEKLLVELGGQDPGKTLSSAQLSVALTQAIEVLAEQRSPLLEKLYRQFERAGEVPPLDK
jgi:hypothetical protein